MGLFDRFKKPKPKQKPSPSLPTQERRRAVAASAQPGFRVARVEEPRPVFSELQPRLAQTAVRSDGSRPAEFAAFDSAEAFEIVIVQDGDGESDEMLLNLELLLKIEDEVLELIEPAFAKEQIVLPISKQDNTVTVACSGKQSQQIAERALGSRHKSLRFKFVCSTEEILSSAIDFHYMRRDLDSSKARETKRLKQISNRIREIDSEESSSKSLIFTDAGKVCDADSALYELIESLLCLAHKRGATDIGIDHFSAEIKAIGKKKETLVVGVCIDGDNKILHEEETPLEKYSRLVQILKVLSGCDANNAWDGQSGVIRAALAYSTQETTVEFRVNFLPSGDGRGESICIRIQEKQNFRYSIENIGLLPFQLSIFKHEAVNLSSGLVDIVASINEGKNSTMTCLIKEIQKIHPSKRIVAVEDPPEFTLPGVIQIAVDRKRTEENGEPRSFYYYLKHLLRHNADVMSIGEVRDEDTARMAVELAGIGHLALTTMHTADSIEAIGRLRNLQVENYKIAAALKIVIAQRLVKRICPDCELELDMEAPSIARLGEYVRRIRWNKEVGFWRASGRDRQGRKCMTCNGEGFAGRTGVFEILTITRRIRSLIAEGATPDRMREAALKEGFRSLWSVGLEKALLKQTTLGEILYRLGKPDPELEGLPQTQEISESNTAEMPALGQRYGEAYGN